MEVAEKTLIFIFSRPNVSAIDSVFDYIAMILYITTGLRLTRMHNRIATGNLQ